MTIEESQLFTVLVLPDDTDPRRTNREGLWQRIGNGSGAMLLDAPRSIRYFIYLLHFLALAISS